MNKVQASLARKQLERRLAPLRNITLTVPPRGWIRAIRESIGMTARQLALRMSVAPSRIPTIEKAELTGATTLRTMRQVAAALDCAFVYALVPIEPLDEMLRDRAMKTAREDIARLNQTMRLENQALLTSDLDAERQRAIELILAGSLRGLWDEDHDRHA